MWGWNVHRMAVGGLIAIAGVLWFCFSLHADTWRETKTNVEWAFKFGAVSVALEKCPFDQGERYAELETNSREVPSNKEDRSYDEGREFMLIMDGSELGVLCGTALRFFGPEGRDLPGVLATKAANNAP